jgi:hypothetical protein
MSSLTFFNVALFFLLIINLSKSSPIKTEVVPDRITSNADLAAANSGLQLLADAARMVHRMEKESELFPFQFSPIKRPQAEHMKQNQKRRKVIEPIPRLLFLDDAPGEAAGKNDARVISPLAGELSAQSE